MANNMGFTDDTSIPVYTKNGLLRAKYNADIQKGDYVFDRNGKPVLVTDVYTSELQQVYKILLSDGRYIYAGSGHLWTYAMSGNADGNFVYTETTEELYIRGTCKENTSGTGQLKYWLPMGKPIDYPDANLKMQPYILGRCIGSCSADVSREIISSDNRIPEEYLYASIKQRQDLIDGLFDSQSASYDERNDGLTCIVESYPLAKDIQNIMFSLGISGKIFGIRDNNAKDGVKFRILVKSSDDEKFYKPKWVGIEQIELMNEKRSTTYIIIDSEEHLYQAGQFIVSHDGQLNSDEKETDHNGI